MEYPSKEINEYIKEVLSENPYFNATEDKTGTIFGQKISNDINISDYFNQDTYGELSQRIYADIFCENIILKWIAGENGAGSSMLPDIDSAKAKNAFDESFRYLYTNWHKFTPRSINNDREPKYTVTGNDFPFTVFKAIYNKCPMLCYRAFPVVLFIIADSFYDFYAKGTGKSGYLPQHIKPEKEQMIFDFFHGLMTQDNKTNYMLSLLNSKGLNYADSSIKIGKEIANLAFDAKSAISLYHDAQKTACSENPDFDDLIDAFATMEELEESNIVEVIFKKFKKRYKDGYDQKKEDRASRNSVSHIFPTKPMIGENFLAFLNLLTNQPDNIWKKGVDTTISLYAINRITGWISLYLLHTTFPAADYEYGLSSFDISHLYSLRYILDQVDKYSDYDENDTERYPINGWLEQFLLDMDKLYALISNNYALASSDTDYEEIDNIFPDLLEDAELYDELSKTLNNMKEGKKNYKWFDLDRLAGAFTHFILGQYAKELTSPVSDII